MARLTKKFPNELNPKELPDVGVITMKVNEVVRIGMERLTKSGNVKSFHWNVFNHAVPGQSVRNILPVEAMTKDVKFSSDMFVSEIEFSRPLFPKK